ncbi:MAG: ATP-NAD/AcoX kinase [Anaerocolumna sp.]|nr:ATP-NAD/AcoX kinase [Anaerocolumna sp.]
MDKFCLITNRDKDINLEITNQITSYMRKNNKECILLEGSEIQECGCYCTDTKEISADIECAIVLGGDGTIIQAANDLLGKNIPIMGINLGTLGFLAEIEKENIYTALDALYEDNYRKQERMMLYGKISSESMDIFEGTALNDIVITRSGFSRIISVSIYINEELVDRFRGDGVIVSTPTGSTGYSLSSGGPVIKPDAKVMVITPICPHTLGARSIVISAEDSVRIQINESKKTQDEEAIATIDGRKVFLLHSGDYINVSKAKETTNLIKINGISFFNILRTKIGQGGE